MGPVGQDIYSTFSFNSTNEREDINILLNNFDMYCTFATKRRQSCENTYRYINSLKVNIRNLMFYCIKYLSDHIFQSMTVERDVEDAEELIKLKISSEIDKSQFTQAAKTLLPTFTFLSNFNKLTLKEIAFIWSFYESNFVNNCKRCGYLHDSNICPALGKQCSKCNEWNHFKKRCPLLFTTKCNNCGGAHFKKQCPAFNEICTKCKNVNHFSWACRRFQVLCCDFCGLTHSRNRSVCLASNAICTNCKSKGHFASKCKKSNFSKH